MNLDEFIKMAKELKLQDAENLYKKLDKKDHFYLPQLYKLIKQNKFVFTFIHIQAVIIFILLVKIYLNYS